MENATTTNLMEDTKEKAEFLSFDLFGVADPFCSKLQRAPEEHKPQDYFPNVKSIISLGMRLINPVIQTTPSVI